MPALAAIVGRPNVGKSTLFNRLVGERKAIVDDQSGVTRDRHYGSTEWNGVTFNIIDTGGYVPKSDDVFEAAIREQVHIAMEEADLLIFMVDVMSGVLPLDEDFANIVRRSKKPVLLVGNKVDHHDRQNLVHEFYELGLGEPWPISSVNGAGTGDFLDELVKQLPEDVPDDFDGNIPKFAIVGRPNVGKSSLVNAFLGKDALIVTPISGTTRDTIHTRFKSFGHDLYLIDTAGLRKKAKAKENVEFYSTLRTISAIENCDVALLMIDASQGLEAQDLAILSLIIKHRKGIVIVVNKWDLIKKDTFTAKEIEDEIREKIEPLSGVPILFISIYEKQRVLKALKIAEEVYAEKKKMIPTAKLNEVMQIAVRRHNPPAIRGKFIKIKYVTQIEAKVPTFLFFANHPKLIQENYKRYLENKIRENFGFEGVPINVFFRDK